MTPTHWTTISTPIGELTLTGDETHVTGVHMEGQSHRAPGEGAGVRDDERLAEPAGQLAEYFAGGRTGFDIDVAFEGGTEFQRSVWNALLGIPHGETISYAALAARLGRPGAVRAVGAANGRNPVAIIVPCHRVVGSDGSLTGYAGGLERKRWLLDLEAGRLDEAQGG